MVTKKTIKNEAEMGALATALGKNLRGGDVVALVGTLGAGKTTFVKALLKSVGIKKRVTSPTFVMCIPYGKGDVTYHHFDLYRAKTFSELEALGMADILGDPRAITLIEWADKFPKDVPKRAITVSIEHGAKATERHVTIKNARL